MTESFRHFLVSTAPFLTPHQWELAIAHLEEAFRASLFPIHTLTTVHADRANRSLATDAGLQLANLKPIGDDDKLRQLAMSILQLPDQLTEDTTEDEAGEKPSYMFELRVFPLCSHEADRPPLDV